MPDPAQVRHAVVFFSRGLGDHLLALPTMRALCALFPGKLTLLVSHSAPDLLFGGAEFARIVELEMNFRDADALMYDPRHAARQLGPQDLFLSVLPGGVREWAQLAEVLRPRWMVGVADGFACRIPVRPALHALERTFVVPRAFDRSLQPAAFAAPLPLPAESVHFVETLRSRLRGRRLLIIHGETKPEKQWSPSAWTALLSRFFAENPDFAGIEIFRDHSALISGLSNILSLRGLPLASAMALVAAADLVVCTDSLFLHTADLWHTPTVALFGPTEERIWGARFNPVYKFVQAASMDTLKVDPVLAAMDNLARYIRQTRYRPLPLNPGGHFSLIRWT